MNLGAVALKLRAGNTRFGNRVVGAAELALAQEYTLQNETCFVVPVNETMKGPNTNDTTVIQKVIETFGVVVAIKNDTATTDKLGLKAFDAHMDVRAEIFDNLLGWLIPGAETLLYYTGGRTIDITPAWLWYMFEFTYETFITSKDDGVEQSQIFNDLLLKVYSQYKIGGDGVLPLTGPEPQLPTNLLTPTLIELFGPEFNFGDAFGKGMDTVDTNV